jgi:hypothetical protein
MRGRIRVELFWLKYRGHPYHSCPHVPSVIPVMRSANRKAADAQQRHSGRKSMIGPANPVKTKLLGDLKLQIGNTHFHTTVR